MKSKLTWTAVCAAVVLVAGCAGRGTTSNDDESAIHGGQLDLGDLSVGLLKLSNGGVCTGTLISPRIVLTAGHCTPSGIETFSIGGGAAMPNFETPAGMATFPVEQVVAHPAYHSVETGSDIALVLLRTPVVGLAPASISLGPPPLPGATCTAIGFGYHDENGIRTLSQKRSAWVQVTSVDASTLKVLPVTGISAEGDSGGPLACGGRVVATVSAGHYPNGSNQSDWVRYTRVDAFLDWIVQNVSSAGEQLVR